MDSQIIAWCVAGLAAFACLALVLRGRGHQSAAEASARETAAAQKEARELRKQVERHGKKQEGRGDESADLRRRLEKAKKRAAQLLDEQRGQPARIAALEQDLADKTGELSGARLEIGDLGARILKLESEARARAEAPVPETASPVLAPVRETASPVLAPVPETASPEAGEALSAAEAERDALRAQLADLRAQLAKSKHEIAQNRSRIKTQDKLYMAIRGELAAKKDRLKQQQEEIERLLALRATLMGVALVSDEPGAPDAVLAEAGPDAGATDSESAAPIAEA